MSNRKDAANMSSTTKKAATKLTSKERDASVDRKKKLELQSSQKAKSKPIIKSKLKNLEKTSKSDESNSTLIAVNKKLKNKPETLLTPSGSRITTSKFFPSKSMYSNALKTKDVTGKKLLEEQSTKQVPKKKVTGGLVKYNIKTENSSSPDTSTISERPRTATLRKGSIVNANIAGPEAPKILYKSKTIKPEIKVLSPKEGSSEEDKYEEDFESYESDFEEYSSSNSTSNLSVEEASSSSSTTSLEEFKSTDRKLSLQTKPLSISDEEKKLDSGHFDMSDYKHKQILNNIKESIEKENTNLLINNPASLSDEGFEEQKSLQFINFLDAKKKNERRKSLENKLKRGREILNMIRLDFFSFTLFELPPVSYETFIKNFGKGNSIQTACQTGDDDVNEEVQTDGIVCSTKWTQEPRIFTNFNQDTPDFWKNYKNEYLGCGSEDEIKENKDCSQNSLNKFLLSSGELMLRLLEESTTNTNTTIQTNNKTLPFSDGYYTFNTTKDIFINTQVSYVSFSCDISIRVITVFTKNRNSLVAVWSISNYEEPEDIFKIYGIVTCCCFGVGKSELVYMGLEDGSIFIWNTRHKRYNKGDSPMTVPNFSTDINSGHKTKIVALHILDTFEEKTYNHQTNELCSLDEDGEIILWTIIQKRLEDKVILVKNTSISLKLLHPDLTDLQCTDFTTSSLNTNYLFVSTNYGFIIHHLIKGGRSTVKKFLPGTDSIAKCLESCPFSSEYFLSGYDNGNINIYSRSSEKPLIILSDKDKSIEYCPIDIIQWSKNIPVIVYTKDAKNKLNIWYLNESDMFPIYSIPFEEEITCMKLSPVTVEYKKSFLMIGTKTGSLYLYQLNEEHGQQPTELYEESVKTFLKYVNRL